MFKRVLSIECGRDNYYSFHGKRLVIIEYGLCGFHDKRVLSIEYDTNCIVFMANVLLLLTTVCVVFMAKGLSILSTVVDCIEFFFIANVSVLDAGAVETMVRMIFWASALCKARS